MTRSTILIPCLLTGGTEVATLDAAKVLTELGFTVTVVVYFDETDPLMLSAFQQAGIDVHLLGLARGGGVVCSLVLARALARKLWQQRPALVWVQYITPTLIPLLIARLFGRHLVAAVHVAARHYSPSGLRRLRWVASCWCDRLICVSKTTASGILGEQSDTRLRCKIRVIFNTLDMQAALAAAPHDWREELSISGDSHIIGYVGRLAHNKGVDVLLKAALLVDKQLPDTHWVVVGNGAEKLCLQQLVSEAGLTSRVHFVGNLSREAVFSALKGFDIAVVPSREEGFGLTALEAMACGVPIVASRVDALEEIINEDVTGLLFRVNDHADLADSLIKLRKSPTMRASLATAAATHVMRNYARERLIEKIRAMVFEIMDAELLDN